LVGDGIDGDSLDGADEGGVAFEDYCVEVGCAAFEEGFIFGTLFFD